MQHFILGLRCWFGFLLRGGLVLACVVMTSVVYADTCGNDDDDDDEDCPSEGECEDCCENPEQECCEEGDDTDDSCDEEEAGDNRFRAYSGGVKRYVTDLQMNDGVGRKNLSFRRISTSRWVGGLPTPLGSGGNWRHSYYWEVTEMTDTNGTVWKNGGPILTVHSPNGTEKVFDLDSPSSPYFTARAKTRERIMRSAIDTNQYYLMKTDGTRFAFYRGTNGTYVMQGLYDRIENFYAFDYDEGGRLTRISDPLTNHYLTIMYSSPSNFTQEGWASFQWFSTNASSVAIAGTFNDWNANGASNPMYHVGSGLWTGAVFLTEGAHEYKIVENGTEWFTDTNNPFYNAFNNDNSVIQVGVEQITSVQSSDGREVRYHYELMAVDGLAHSCLVRAEYGDVAYASYIYDEPATGKYWRPMLIGADDPMVSGPGSRMAYIYQRQTNTNMGPNGVSGMIYEERHLITSQLIARLVLDDSNPQLRIIEDGDGSSRTLVYPTNQFGRVAVVTNEAGYVTTREHYLGFGMLKTYVNAKGIATTFERTAEFGMKTVISNQFGVQRRIYYTDPLYPIHVSSNINALGHATHFERDSKNRITTLARPDGTEETTTYNQWGQPLEKVNCCGGDYKLHVYDDLGRLASVTDANNSTTHYTYDAYGRQSSVSNALGYLTRYFYNWRGVLTNVVYPDETQDIYQYDTYGLLTNHIQRNSGVTSISYDERGYVQSRAGADGQTIIYTRDLDGRELTKSLPSGLVISNTYDVLGRKTRETYSSNNTFNEWHYDPMGVRTQINRLGYATTYAYTPEGWLEQSVDPLGRVTSNAFDAAGRRISTVNPEGGLSTTTYDAMDRVLTQTDCSGAVWSNSYDSAGRIVTRTDPNGIVTLNTYDDGGRLVSVHLDGQLVSSNRYDAIGRAVSRQDADGLVITNTYDAAGRLLTMHMPDGSISQNIYSNTYLHQTIDRAGRVTTYDRDIMGRVLSQIDNGSNSVQYAYDVSGNMTNLIDQSGNHTAWSYDLENRQIQKSYHDGKTIEYDYDAGGRLISKLDAGIRTTSYHYDPVGNMTNIVYPNDPQVLFRYDVMNRMIEMVDGVGTTTYDYACGKLVESIDSFGQNVVYGYDDGSRLTNAAYAGYDVGYAYDGLGRITAVSGPGGVSAYQYTANGSRLSLLEHANGMETHYGYDELMRLTNVTHATSGDEVRSSYAYSYNDADLRTSMTVGDATPSSRNIDYDYDPIGQLTGADGDFPGYRYAYAYDPSGNPILQDKNGLVSSNIFNELNQNVTSRWGGVGTVWGVVNITNGSVEVNGVEADILDGVTFVATNLPLTQGSNTFSAVLTDPFGRADTNQISVEVTDRGYGYDVYGNLTNDGKLVYAWDDADRLIEVRSPEGALLLKNRYDGLSRRMEKVMGGQTNRYLYSSPQMGSGWLVLAVADGDNDILEVYSHGPDMAGTLGGAGGIGGILSVIYPDSSDRHAFHYDANGNVVQLTDTNEIVVSHYEYSPFGEVLISRGTAAQRYQFSTKEHDSAAGLNYYGYRFYNPVLGRWPNRDPIADPAFRWQLLRFVPSRNRESLARRALEPAYVFVENGPPNSIDILGLDNTNPGGGGQNTVCCVKNPPLPTPCKDALDNMMNLYHQVKDPSVGLNDDYGHCLAFCGVSKGCGLAAGAVAAYVGYLKECVQEIAETFGGSGSEWVQDNKANVFGTFIGASDTSCEQGCQNYMNAYYPDAPLYTPQSK